MDRLNLDYETRSEVDLKVTGLSLYSRCMSTEIIMASWSMNGGEVKQWDMTQSERPPAFLLQALASPDVEKWAFNAQFERVISEFCWEIERDYEQWRCSMVRAYSMGFVGDLASVGSQMGIDQEHLKSKEGLRLIHLFSKPQRVTRNQPHRWRTAETDPEDYERYLKYNRQDVVAELAIQKRLSKYPTWHNEWKLYALDQKINDYGVRVNRVHAKNALAMAAERKTALLTEMRELTKLSNPSSPVQLTPWLQDLGYPFDDIQKDTVKKVLAEPPEHFHEDAVAALKLRQLSSRTSTAKYNAMLKSTEETDDIARYILQCRGAQRTGRFAGRNIQVHNLMRTPKELEEPCILKAANDAIVNADMDMLSLIVSEPMDALAGCVRSAFIPREGKEFRVADLSSIESVIIAWFTECRWFLDVLDRGQDLYRAFASEWLKMPYEDTMPFRSMAKPATLGAGFRLGGGELISGKKTGLWGYAENMGVSLTREESHQSVAAFRELCPEIVDAWKALEKAVFACIRTRQPQKVIKCVVEYHKPFLTIKLPSGRRLYYFKPAIKEKTFTNAKTGETWTRPQFTYMGKEKDGKKWVRLDSHGGKLIENIVQAGACDVLCYGMLRADAEGFDIPLHVHDEIVGEADKDDDEHTLEALMECMTRPIKWAKGLNLKAAGYIGDFYRKD